MAEEQSKYQEIIRDPDFKTGEGPTAPLAPEAAKEFEEKYGHLFKGPPKEESE